MRLGRACCVGIAVCAAMLLSPMVAAGSSARVPASPPVATTSRPNPEAYGISQETVTSIPAAALVSWSSVTEPLETRLLNGTSYVRYIDNANGGTYFVPVSLPSGAMIDFLGLSTCDTVGGRFTASLIDFVPGNGSGVGSIVSTARVGDGCGIDYNTVPFGYSYAQNEGHNLLVAGNQVAGTLTDGTAGLQAVEVWWHRQVGPAPAVPTFNDVPDTDIGYQYVEALAASGITGGCGGGSFCPDNPVTRRQMAIFIAKALGLNWPH